MRPFAGARPAVLLLPAVASVLLLGTAARLAARRDLGSGLLPARGSAEPRLALLSSPAAQALRSQRGSLIAWTGCFAVFMFILGIVSGGVSPADIPKTAARQLGKLGTGSIATPSGYLSFIFFFVMLAVSLFACAQIGTARREEAGQQLETLLALPVSRVRWLGGRLLIAAGGIALISLTSGLLTWAGAACPAGPGSRCRGRSRPGRTACRWPRSSSASPPWPTRSPPGPPSRSATGSSP